MTTVHASIPPVSGEALPNDPSFVHLTLHPKSGSVLELEASLSEVLEALKSSDGAPILELQIGDADERTVVLQAVEKDGSMITQMTLREVSPDDYIKVDLELATKGVPKAVQRQEAEAVRLRKRVKVRSRIKDLPKRILVDLSRLSPQQTVCAGELTLPKGVELLTPKDEQLFTVRAVKSA